MDRAATDVHRSGEPTLTERRGATEREVGRAFVRGSAGTLGLRGISTGLGFVSTLILAHILHRTGYGEYAWAIAWVGVLQLVAVLGLDRLLVREIAVYHARGNWDTLHGLLRRSNQAVFALSLALAAGMALVGWLALGAGDSRRGPLFVAALLLPTMALLMVRLAALQGFQRVVVGRLPEDLLRPLLFLVLLSAAWAIRGDLLSASGVLALQVVAATISLAVATVLLRRTVQGKTLLAVPAYETRAWSRSGLHLLFISGMVLILSQADIIMVGAFKGAASTGVYAVAARGALLINLIALAMNIAVAPLVARLHAEADREALRRLATRSARAMLALSAAAGLVLALFSPFFLGLFGAGFVAGSTALRVLIVGYVINAATGANGTILIMTGYERAAAVGVAVGAVANVGLNAALIPTYGINGAAVAGTLSIALWNVALVVVLWRRLGIDSTPFGFHGGRLRGDHEAAP